MQWDCLENPLLRVLGCFHTLSGAPPNAQHLQNVGPVVVGDAGEEWELHAVHHQLGKYAPNGPGID